MPFVLRSVGAWVLLLVVAVCATGCAKESASAPVSVWVLRASNRAPTTVVLPAKLDRLLEQRPQTFRLEAEVLVPPELRSLPLVFVIPHLWAPLTLSANGLECESVEREVGLRFRPRGPHAFVIPASAASTGRLAFVMTIDHQWTQSAWLETIPVLTTTESRAYASYSFARDVSEYGSGFGMGCIAAISLAYGVIFLIDRRRKAHGWIAVQGLSGGWYCVLLGGASQRIFGLYDMPVVMALLTVAALCQRSCRLRRVAA